VLVDHARARVALKRGGDRLRVTLDDGLVAEEKNVVDMIAIDRALTKLEQLDARIGAATHLTYFAGLRGVEVADLLKVSVATVERDLRFARGWLRVELRNAT